MRHSNPLPNDRQRGAAAVEFAIVCLLFFTILFAILEFGRMMYVYNTMQEVTRRAAREAVVRWISTADQNTIKSLAFFGGAAIPAGGEVTAAAMNIEYLNEAGDVITSLPADPGANLAACGNILLVNSCIFSVRVSIVGVSYSPMVSLFSFLGINLPPATVTMQAESLGFEI
jgi:TadE-like protein